MVVWGPALSCQIEHFVMFVCIQRCTASFTLWPFHVISPCLFLVSCDSRAVNSKRVGHSLCLPHRSSRLKLRTIRLNRSFPVLALLFSILRKAAECSVQACPHSSPLDQSTGARCLLCKMKRMPISSKVQLEPVFLLSPSSFHPPYLQHFKDQPSMLFKLDMSHSTPEEHEGDWSSNYGEWYSSEA